MIDKRVTRGDSFKFLGLLGCENSPTFDISNLNLKVVLRKAGGGIVIQELQTVKGQPTEEESQIVVPFEIRATFQETALWPIGPACFDVQVTYETDKVTSRTINLSIEEGGR